MTALALLAVYLFRSAAVFAGLDADLRGPVGAIAALCWPLVDLHAIWKWVTA